jgi:hypothetical protein
MPTNSAQHDFSLVLEAAYGTTPATPALLRTPITGTTLALTKGTIESEIIQANRQIVDVRHGNRQVGGEISGELIYGAFDDMLEAVFCGTWTANALIPGVTRRSYSMLRQYTDLLPAANPCHLFLGCEFNTLQFALAPETMLKLTFGVVGRAVMIGGTPPVGAVFTPAATLKPFDSFTGALTVDTLPVAYVTELTLTIENGLEPRFAVFSDLMNRPKIGRTRVTGTLTAYFEDSAMLVAFNNAVKRALAFTVSDLGGNDYIFTLPSILLTGGGVDVAGEDDITISIPFSAIYEAGTGTPDALKLARNPGP